MRISLAAAAALLVASPAPAQQQPLAVTAGQPYRHQASGLGLPATLDGLPRSDARSLEPEVDEMFGYRAPDGGEEVTVYLFRHVAGDVPVWFDRVVAQLETRDAYKGVTQFGPPQAFALPGQTVRSGLMAVYAPKSGPFTSTAAAVMPLGSEWFVAIRQSSVRKSPEQLQQHLSATIAQIGWPANMAPQREAVPVQACSDALAFSGSPKPVKTSGENTVLSSILAMAAADSTVRKSEADASVVFCRDKARLEALPASGVYRPNGDRSRYLVAINDAGRGIVVGPDAGATLLDKKAKPSWSTQLIELRRVTSYPPLDRLPSPDTALKLVRSGAAMSRSSTWGKQRQVTLDSKTLK